MATHNASTPEHPELDIGDPFQHWTRQAYALAAQLHLPVDFIDEARSIVASAFTREWLESVFERPVPRGSLPTKRVHPLEALFSVAGPSQIVELIELAVYLKHLAPSTNIGEVIAVMKDNYQTGLLQLAYAYRFKRVGGKNIELEPRTDRGKSDIYFEYAGRSYLTECYVPKLQPDSYSYHRMSKPFQRALAACKDIKARLRVCIRLKRSITTKEAKSFAAWLSQEIRTSGGAPATVEHELANCALERISDADEHVDFPVPGERFRLYGDADFGLEPHAVAAVDIPRLRVGEAVQKLKGSRIFVWLPPNEGHHMTEDEWVSELAKRLPKKISQTKRINDTPGRVVVAEASLFRDDQAATLRVARRVQMDLVPRHHGLSAIILTQRYWMRMKRYQFHGQFLLGRDNCALPSQLFTDMNEAEQQSDVLWDYGGS